MRAVVVKAELSGPMVDHGNPIHLDGILGAAWALRHPQFAHMTRLDDPDKAQRPHLPLGRVEHAGTYIWLASAAQFDEDAPARLWQTSRRDPDDWDRLAAPVDVQAGPRKDRLIRTQAYLVRGVTWLAWGKLQEIKRSLRLLWGREGSPHGALGSVRRAGAGQIVRWSVEHGEHLPINVLVSPGEGVFLRHVPAAWIEGTERLRRGAHLPPYWHPMRQGAVAQVGCKDRLSLGARTAIMEQALC